MDKLCDNLLETCWDQGAETAETSAAAQLVGWIKSEAQKLDFFFILNTRYIATDFVLVIQQPIGRKEKRRYRNGFWKPRGPDGRGQSSGMNSRRF
ncbi:hypothetical protein DWB84_14320 [Saccharophagus sp. K07]|nr:hypothetical protein [Saccharophagus sp. K07]